MNLLSLTILMFNQRQKIAKSSLWNGLVWWLVWCSFLFWWSNRSQWCLLDFSLQLKSTRPAMLFHIYFGECLKPPYLYSCTIDSRLSFKTFRQRKESAVPESDPQDPDILSNPCWCSFAFYVLKITFFSTNWTAVEFKGLKERKKTQKKPWFCILVLVFTGVVPKSNHPPKPDCCLATP